MKSPPLVSICIPTYNRPEYLRRAVESCLAQTMPDFEIVITDNSTNDDSAALAARWTDPRIRYCRNDGNIGPIASCNRVVSLSRGRYIKFLMDDDLLKPRCLELLAAGLEKFPGAGVAMAPMDLIDDMDRRIHPKFYIFQRMHYRYRYQIGDGLVDRRRLLKDFLTIPAPCPAASSFAPRRCAGRAPMWPSMILRATWRCA
jgi:glycosyltransferase involved in cell wall biosynthesis